MPLIQSALQAALKFHRPVPTTTGTSSSYFLKNKAGKIVALFKPMSGEVGRPTSDKLMIPGKLFVGHGKTIWAGQGAGNERLVCVVAKALNYNTPQTFLMTLSHPDFTQFRPHKDRQICAVPGTETQLGAIQAFVANATPLDKLPRSQCEQIPQTEFVQFNLGLLTGNTDANLSNFLYDAKKKKLISIDGALHFPGPKDHALMARQDWLRFPQARKQMPKSEYDRLRNINVDGIVDLIVEEANKNAQLDPVLAMSADKLLSFKLRLELGKLVGSFEAKGITQHDWATVLSRGKLGADSPFARIFAQEIAPNIVPTGDWKTEDNKTDWDSTRTRLSEAICAQLQQSGKSELSLRDARIFIVKQERSPSTRDTTNFEFV